MKKIDFIKPGRIFTTVLLTFAVVILTIVCETTMSLARQENDIEQKNSNAARQAKTANRNRQPVSPKPVRRAQAQAIYKVKVIVVDPENRPTDEAKVWSPLGVKPSKIEGGWQFDIPATSKQKNETLIFYASKSDFLRGKKDLKLSNYFNPEVIIRLSEEGVLPIYVVNTKGQPLEGVKLCTTAYGSIGEMTNSDGKARILLEEGVKPNDEVELTIVEPKSMDLAFVEPWDNRVKVPSFDKTPLKITKIRLSNREQKDQMIALAIAKRVIADDAPTTANEKPTEERKQANRDDKAKDYGLTASEADREIRKLGAETTDQYEQGITALYAEDYPKAISLLSDSLRQREEEEKIEATSEAEAKVAEAARFLGLALGMQARYSEAVVAFQKAHDRNPDNIAILRNLSLALYSDGQYSRTEKIFKQLLEPPRKSPVANNLSTASDLQNLADIYRIQSKFKEAEIVANQALSIRKKLLRPDDPDIAHSLSELASIYQGQGKFDEAEKLSTQALMIFDKTIGRNHSNVSFTLQILAQIYEIQGKFDEAERYYKQALSCEEKRKGPDSSGVAIVLGNLATFYLIRNELTEVESLAKRAVTGLEKVLGAHHHYLASPLITLGKLYNIQGNYNQAEIYCERALTILERAFGKDNYSLVPGLILLTTIYENREEYNKSQPIVEQILKISETALPPDHLDIAVSLNNLAWNYYLQGKYIEAKPYAEKAIAILERNPNDSFMARILDTLASILSAQGEYSQSEQVFKRGLALFEKLPGPSHPDVAMMIRGLATLYRDWGKSRYADAEKLFQQAIDIQEQKLGVDTPELANTLREYALLLRKTYREAEAAKLEKRAEAIKSKQIKSKPKN